MRAQLVLLRHGETEWSRLGRHTGRSDIPLTADGEQQAAAAGEWLAERRRARGRDFAIVRTSPLSRARRTAELAGYPSAEVDDDLAEWDYGPVDGRTAADIGESLGRHWDIFADGVNVVPGSKGETLTEVANRAHAVISRLIPALSAGEDALLVAHGHLLRILAAVWLGADPSFGARLELGTAAICLLGTEHGRHAIEVWNLTRE